MTSWLVYLLTYITRINFIWRVSDKQIDVLSDTLIFSMDSKVRYIIFFIIALILFVILIQQDSDYKIVTIQDGNTLVLESGTTVRLIGVTSTMEGKEYLEQHFLNTPVNLLCDQTAPFDASMVGPDDVVYAYVIGGENANVHINAQLLREGKAGLLTGTFLHDSLSAFRNYALSGGGKGEELTPTPIPVIDYEDDDIILPEPPCDRKKERKHSAWYTDGNMNLEMLDDACDYLCPYTKQFANSLAGKSPGPFNAGQICEIFDYCFNNWKYVNDPNGHEYVASASESIEGNLAGDCDDFAILMASCMLAIGGDACLNIGAGTEGCHAFTEVDISPVGLDNMKNEIKGRYGSDATIATRIDGNHIWLNLDWFGIPQHPGGRYFDCREFRDSYPCVNGVWKWEKLN